MHNIRLASRDRRDRFLQEGVPRYLWCYADGGVTAGRYTAVFTGHFDLKQPVEYPYLTLGEDPAAIRRSGLRR